MKGPGGWSEWSNVIGIHSLYPVGLDDHFAEEIGILREQVHLLGLIYCPMKGGKLLGKCISQKFSEKQNQ